MDKNNKPNSPASTDSTKTIAPHKFEPLGADKPVKSISIRRSTLMVAISLLICVSIAAFLFTARAIYIETTPTFSSIEIGGLLHLKLADRYLLLSGEHELTISATGYQDLHKNLIITSEPDQHYTFELQRLPGHLRVNTDPVTGAEIFIDDVLLDKTPALLRNIAAGEHKIRIVAARYFVFEQNLPIEGLDKEQSLNASLVQAWADVDFTTEPVGADIFVDEELLGQTPFTTEILQGKHKVRLQLAGHKPWQDEINVIANEAMDLTAIHLDPADAMLFLASEPPRANVTVDGEYRGLTPLELVLTPTKKSTLRLFKQGYKPASREINVDSGNEQRLIVKLLPELVKVEFNVVPSDAKLYINGKARGGANQILELPALSHRIEIRKQGYISYNTKISPHAGIAEKVNVRLKSERQARQEKIKPIYTNTAGQILKLFYPTAFTMGASRREPGRRANETIRNIEMKRPFYLGTHEVTNAQYKKFAKDHNSGTVQGNNLDGDRQPAVKLSWEQAALYCNQLSKAESLTAFYKENDNKITGVNPSANGYRLPTEAEWAWAARVNGKNSMRKFPWGQQMPPPANSGNYADNSSAGFLGKVIPNYNDGYMVSAPVGSFPATAAGLFDIGGNVAEWVNDFYDIQLGFASQAEVDPLGPGSGEFHVIRGSSWAHGTVTELRLSYRDYNARARDDVGFRIARYLE